MMEDDDLHAHLDNLLTLRKYQGEADKTGAAALGMLTAALRFARTIMTDEVFNRAMLKADDGDGLFLLANRVQRLAPLLSHDWPAGFTFDELVNDLFAVANGDEPRIIRRDGKQGRFWNAHALVEKKLDAHVWYKVLSELGQGAPARQAAIIEAYGITFDAFNKWRREAQGKLGGDYVARYLVTAVDAKALAARSEPDPVAWALQETRTAGDAYQRELRLSKQ